MPERRFLVLAGTLSEAQVYASDSIDTPHWMYVGNADLLRGWTLTADDTIVYLPGFSNRRDHDALEAEILMKLSTCISLPAILDLRHRIPDELLRNRHALEQWLID